MESDAHLFAHTNQIEQLNRADDNEDTHDHALSSVSLPSSDSLMSIE